MKKHLFYLICLTITFNSDALAQPGSLDASFDSDGIVKTHVSGYSQASGDALLIQTDGKIVTGGPMSSGGTLRYVVARYNADGSLDNTFGTNGIANGVSLSANSLINGLALQQDGKILGTGYLRVSGVNNMTALRLNADGSYDTGFNTNGFHAINLGLGNSEANAIAVQSDGKVVFAGEVRDQSDYYMAIIRLNADGSLDNSFSSNGWDTLNFGGTDNRCEALAIQPDGKIIVAGNGHNGWDPDLALARYNTDGTLDNSFGTGGKVLLHYSIAETIRDIVLQPDGKILACGYVVPGGYFVMRLNSDGSLDTSFDSDGSVLGNDANSVANAVVWQDDGSILIAGATFANGSGTESDFFLRRYYYDGAPDNSFGTNGVVYTDIDDGEYDAAYDIASQSDLKVAVSGRGGIQSSAATDILVTRYITGLSVGVVDNTIQQTLIYPNPIQDKATLEYDLTSSQEVSINLYSLDGRMVESFSNEMTQQAGSYKQELNFPASLANGNYLLRIQAGESETTVKVVVER